MMPHTKYKFTIRLLESGAKPPEFYSYEYQMIELAIVAKWNGHQARCVVGECELCDSAGRLYLMIGPGRRPIVEREIRRILKEERGAMQVFRV